jgi:TatD DNase family protein
MLVDSHCHIDDERFDLDRDEVVNRAEAAGVAAMLCVGTGDPKSGQIEKAVKTAQAHHNVFASVGVHPHDAKLYDDAAENRLATLAMEEKVVAWGEIGLDYYYDNSPRDVQREVFIRQICKARELSLPIIVHSRSADDDTVEILEAEYSERLDSSRSAEQRAPGILHCFGGSPETAERLLKLGFLVSFAGNLTFKNAESLREAARCVPLDRLLVETDSPYLAPVPHRGKRCEPAMVVDTARFLAKLLEVPFEILAEKTTENFCRLFGLNSEELIGSSAGSYAGF